jgi:hypothetical protein
MWAGLVSIPVAFALATGGGAATAAPAFVPDQTSAVTRGNVVTLSFVEEGLPPGGAANISVSATTQVISSCLTPGSPQVVLFTSSSSATATELSTYIADQDGQIAASRDLTAAAGEVNITGLGCTVQTTKTVTAVLTDTTNAVSYTIPAQASTTTS